MKTLIFLLVKLAVAFCYTGQQRFIGGPWGIARSGNKLDENDYDGSNAVAEDRFIGWPFGPWGMTRSGNKLDKNDIDGSNAVAEDRFIGWPFGPWGMTRSGNKLDKNDIDGSNA